MLFNKIRQLVLSPTARNNTYVVKEMTAFINYLKVNLYVKKHNCQSKTSGYFY
jgi:hypothetical protein